MIRPLPALAIGLALAAAPLAAAPPEPELRPTLLLTASGSLVVEADGSASEVAVDTPLSAALHPALVATLSKLRFRPVRVGGQLVRASTGYAVTLAGEPLAQGLRVKIDSITFGPVKGSQAVRADGAVEEIEGRQLGPPGYPHSLEVAGIMGEVRLAILVGADGRAEDVGLVRSMLFGQQFRKGVALKALDLLEKTSVQAARAWTFKVAPGYGAHSASERTVLTQVDYVLGPGGLDVRKEGQWLPVLDAPAHAIAWVPAEISGRLAEASPGQGSLAGAGSIQLTRPASGTPVL